MFGKKTTVKLIWRVHNIHAAICARVTFSFRKMSSGPDENQGYKKVTKTKTVDLARAQNSCMRSDDVICARA